MEFIDLVQKSEHSNNGSPYRIQAERSIADMLSAYGIPFYYKQPTLVVEGGRRCIEYVDFFLPTYSGLSIDYLTDPKGTAYNRKRRLYAENQVPAALLTKADISGHRWQQRLYRKLEQWQGNGYRVRGKYR